MIFAGNSVRLAGTMVTRRGDVGRLVLPRWFVELHRIAVAPPDESATERPCRAGALALSRATIAETLEQRANAIRSIPLDQFALRESRMRDAVLLLPEAG